MSEKSLYENRLIYLAVPYTHKNEILREIRYQVVTKLAAILMERGYNILSPITMGHNYAKFSEELNSRTSQKWQKWCKMLLLACDDLWVIKLQGWEESVGVQKEIEWAKTHNINIKYIDYTDKCKKFIDFSEFPLFFGGLENG